MSMRSPIGAILFFFAAATSANAAVFTFSGNVSGPPAVYRTSGPALAAAFPLTDPFSWTVTYDVTPTPIAPGKHSAYDISDVQVILGSYSFSGVDSGANDRLSSLNDTIRFQTIITNNSDFPGFAAGTLYISTLFDFNIPYNGFTPSLIPDDYLHPTAFSFGILTGPSLPSGFYSFRSNPQTVDGHTFLANGITVDHVSISGGLQSGIPEPGSWILLLSGFGVMGGMFRLRKGAPSQSLLLIPRRAARLPYPT